MSTSFRVLTHNTSSLVYSMEFSSRGREVRIIQGILKGKYHCTIDLLCDWLGLFCFANKTKIVSCHTADTKPVKQEVNSRVILPPLVFPASSWNSLRMDSLSTHS